MTYCPTYLKEIKPLTDLYTNDGMPISHIRLFIGKNGQAYKCERDITGWWLISRYEPVNEKDTHEVCTYAYFAFAYLEGADTLTCAELYELFKDKL